MQKLSRSLFPYPCGIRWREGQTSGSNISLQMIQWMGVKFWIITEQGSNWNFVLETVSSMQESPTVSRQTPKKWSFISMSMHRYSYQLGQSGMLKARNTFSISSCKSVIHNAYMLERFICMSGIKPDTQVIDKLFKELILFTTKTA